MSRCKVRPDVPTYRPASINLERVTILLRRQSEIHFGDLRGGH